MPITVYRRGCTLIIELGEFGECPDNCHPFSPETKFIVIVDDVRSTYRMVTRPLVANSLFVRVAIPPYCGSCLVVTVHLCNSLVNDAGWRSVETATTCAIPDEEFAWQHQSDCEHGPTSRQYFVTFEI